ncbi:permease, partial [bacterium]|nr:permease [bacterium]
MLEILQDIVTQTWLITAQMAPYLLLGFLMAGLLSVFISPAWLERHLGGRGPGPVIKAALLGIPLPLCSCGVLPVGASLRQHGAGRSATTAFLLSTPQTGVDSILVTWTMLGPFFALFRPLAALVTGLAGGGAVQVLAPDEHHMVADRSVPDTRPTGLGPRLKA